MASFERNGNRKVRGQLFKRRIPELGYYFIVTDTKETEQNYMFGLRNRRRKRHPSSRLSVQRSTA